MGGRLVKRWVTERSSPETPGDAVDLVAHLAAELDGRCALPLRAGIQFGPVLRRDGDVFGGTVNLAARLVGLADASQALGTYPGC